MSRKKKVLFVSPPHTRGFIKNDIDILKKNFSLKTVYYDYNERSTLVLLVPRLIKGILWSDVVFIWFASYHALLSIIIAKIARKKTILVVGGYEVVNEPEINYGLMKSKFTSWIPKISIRNSDKVICISEYNMQETIKYTSRRNVALIHNGININSFVPGLKEKDDIVLTVGNFYRSTFHLKGLNTFLKVAKQMPDVHFFIVGDIDLKFKSDIDNLIPPNVCFTSELKTEELLAIYQKSKVYCQLSYIESFGVALAEAMACGCVPIVTNKGALSEVVGDVGFYVPYGNTKETVNSIKYAFNSDKNKSARERISEIFSLTIREKKATFNSL